MLYAIFAVLVIILDQGVKLMVSDVIHVEAGQSLIPGILSIVKVPNYGAAFGFLSDSNPRIFFIILTGVFTLAVIIALATKFISGPLARWSIVMVTAGGISNCIDRVIYGYVLDMFKFEPMPNFPVFNVADIFITIFAILFVLAIIFEPDRRRDDEYLDDEFDEDDDEDEDEEEEEERPRRRSARREKRVRRRASRYDDEEDEDEEDEDEEEDEPRRKPVALPRSRRAAAQKPADEPAERPATNREYYPPRATTSHTSKYDAEYEQAMARRARQQAASRPARPAAQELEIEVPPMDFEVPSRPAASAPAPRKSAAEPEDFSVSEEFSLEDILNEFK